jgi:hypothetical protein
MRTSAEYRDVQVRARAAALDVAHHSKTIRASDMDARRTFSLGLAVLRSAIDRFIEEGAWMPVERTSRPPGAARVRNLDPVSSGSWRLRNLSFAHPDPDGWAYARGERFLRILVEAVRRVKANFAFWTQEITTCARCAGGESGPRCRNCLPARCEPSLRIIG